MYKENHNEVPMYWATSVTYKKKKNHTKVHRIATASCQINPTKNHIVPQTVGT